MLLYLVTNTRPDIAASVSILSKHDMLEVKRVIRYLKGTRDLKLRLNVTKQVEDLHAYSGASWAEDKNDMRILLQRKRRSDFMEQPEARHRHTVIVRGRIRSPYRNV